MSLWLSKFHILIWLSLQIIETIYGPIITDRSVNS